MQKQDTSTQGGPTQEGAEHLLFDFERGGTASRRTVADGMAVADTLLQRINAPAALRPMLFPATDAPISDAAAGAAAEVGALLVKFSMHVVLNIGWYELRIKTLKRRWTALQVALWGAIFGGFGLMMWMSLPQGGALSEDTNAWVPLLSAFGTFSFGLFQTVQTSTNQKGKLSAFRTASSALKTSLYELEDTWVDRLSARRGEADEAWRIRLRDEVLPALTLDLETRVRAARKVLRDEQAQTFDADAAPDAFARGLPERLTELKGVLDAAQPVVDPGRAQRTAQIEAAETARAALAQAELDLATASAELAEAERLGAADEVLNTYKSTVESARVTIAGKRRLLTLAEAAVGAPVR